MKFVIESWMKYAKSTYSYIRLIIPNKTLEENGSQIHRHS